MIAVGADSTQLGEFIQVFGMRFLGLLDPSSTVYQAWRVPNPTAPYPQDYVIDRGGVVRYWSDRYDPQEVTRTIDRLLASGAAESDPGRRSVSGVIRPSVGLTGSSLHLSGPPGALVRIFCATGRSVASLRLDQAGSAEWQAKSAPGVYQIRAGSAVARVVVASHRP